MPLTTAQQNAFLDEYFAEERFMSLHSADPGAAGSYSAEVPTADTGYERQSLLGKIGAASGGVAVNTLTISFPVVEDDYPVVSFFGVGDAVTAGTMGIIGYFNESSLRTVGQRYQFAPGTIRFRLQ